MTATGSSDTSTISPDQRVDQAHDSGSPLPQPPSQTLTAIQVHNTYLVSENEEGMLVIDQHALHERVIYEQIRDKVFPEDACP